MSASVLQCLGVALIPPLRDDKVWSAEEPRDLVFAPRKLLEVLGDEWLGEK